MASRYLGRHPPLRPDRKHVADQQHSDHQFRVDRGASDVAVERRKLLVDPAKIEHSINPPYHVIGWNHFIEMECVAELRLGPLSADPSRPAPPTLIVSAHRITLRRPHQSSFATQSGAKRTYSDTVKRVR